MKSVKNSNHYVLITGGSKGIGFELAKRFGKNGYNLILVARNQSHLIKAKDFISSFYNIKILTISCDLTKRDASNEIYKLIKSNKLIVDILINNAGFGTYGPFIETHLNKELDMIKLNIRSLTHMTKLFAKDMAKRGKGKILNIASTASFQPGPYMAVYFATKALNSEFKRYGISISALCSGPTKTNFIKIVKGCGKTNAFQKLLSPKQVASVGYNTLMRGKMVEVVGIKNKMLAALIRIMPRRSALSISKFMMSKIK